MGDFIGHAFKLVVIYFVFYWLSVFVFGASACVGCAAVVKAGGEWAQETGPRWTAEAAAAQSAAKLAAKPAPSSKVPAPKSSSTRK